MAVDTRVFYKTDAERQKSLLVIFIADIMMVNGDNAIIMVVIVNIYLERIGQ